MLPAEAEAKAEKASEARSMASGAWDRTEAVDELPMLAGRAEPAEWAEAVEQQPSTRLSFVTGKQLVVVAEPSMPDGKAKPKARVAKVPPASQFFNTKDQDMRYARIIETVVVELLELPHDLEITEAFHPEIAATFVSCEDEAVEQGWLYENETFSPPMAPPELTPEEKRAAMPNLTARQLRLGLLHLGKLGGVPEAIAALPEPEKSQAEIEWQFASEFRRLHPLIVQLLPILGLADEDVDQAWLEFSQV